VIDVAEEGQQLQMRTIAHIAKTVLSWRDSLEYAPDANRRLRVYHMSKDGRM